MNSFRVIGIAAAMVLGMSVSFGQSGVLGKGKDKDKPKQSTTTTQSNQGRGQSNGNGRGQATGNQGRPQGTGRSTTGGGQGSGLGNVGRAGQSSGGSTTGRGQATGNQGRPQGNGGIITRGQGSGSSSTGRGQGSGSLGNVGRGQGSGTTNTGRTQGSGTLGNVGRTSTTTVRPQGNGSLGNVGRGGQSSGSSTTRNQGLGNVGRPQRDQTTTRNNDVITRGGGDLGRLGRPNYGGNSNLNQGTTRNNIRIDSIERPRIDLRKGTLQNMVSRTENVRYGQGNFNNFYQNNWRTGYYGYQNNWRDDNFCYPYYQFTPYGNSCSISPWYYYAHCPGYVNANRIIYVNNYLWNWQDGTRYNWGGYDSFDRYDNDRYDNDRYDRDNRNSEVDEALEDICRAFEQQDRRSLNRVIGRRGQVAIYMDSSYMYSLNMDDFYDLMLDNIYNTRTSRYRIYDVRTSRGEVEVAARHEFTDPWGYQQTNYHQYRLKGGRDGYTITDFMTSNRPTIDRY